MSKVVVYIDQLVEALTKFPGVGRKGAERIAYFIVRSNKSVAKDLIVGLDNISEKLSNCDNCGMIFLKEDEDCSCNSNRNASCLCVVENVEDAVKIENTNSYDGLYHVLGGAISPLDGIGPSELSFDKLLNRIDDKLEEIIIATNPSTSGNATAMYLEKILKDKKVIISRLAVGLPVGSNLEYIDDKTVTTAIEGRVKLN
ncbi:MAG: recombination protein RecR [Candidatus Marinimicrobia bacterium]|jgi:recombination protein RecR|nr:recombination protein RecR [Gammaproteobacteria bacterium]MBL6911876.1 recombination protein RecR [Candidatus Neomarinimicrobiota bacterium]MBT3728276.1 recombination protein RecR [Candidatus Neomarinimicrobiota bacterium]MBT3944337.1 recombination protein RecR [Candidatus Neomarinimicrobiota bacterium]MBT4112308.1 recombination protein RecR [Candidatus Neomarinimicrobiota bacterium]